MGLIKRIRQLFQKKEREASITQSPSVENQKKEDESKEDESKETRSSESILDSDCDQVVEATFQMEDLKLEYQLVTAYINDIQLIEGLGLEQREALNETARLVVKLSEDRSNLRNSDNKLPDIQYRTFKQLEKEIPGAIVRLEELEDYNSIVKSDMRQLEGEKGALNYNEEQLIEKQGSLRMTMISFSLMVIIAAILFMVLGNIYSASMVIPITLVILLGITVGALLLHLYRQSIYDLALGKKKYNRAIMLLNKVKIKYVNNTNELEYFYSKYNINSLRELTYLWDKYLKVTEQEKRYKTNTTDLNTYSEQLVHFLKNHKLKDPSVWVYQAESIIDSHEMERVKGNLNVRREKLKEQLDYNEDLKSKAFEEIERIVSKEPQLKEYVISTLGSYNIHI